MFSSFDFRNQHDDGNTSAETCSWLSGYSCVGTEYTILLVIFQNTAGVNHLQIMTVNFSICAKKYRVSIKSFPDYKYLLQENYVEYKHIQTINT